MSEIDLEDYVKVTDLAKEQGVSRQAVRKWLARHKKKRAPFFISLKDGRSAYVRFDIAGQYAAIHETRRPPGWRPLRALEQDCGGSCISWLKGLEKRGLLRVKHYRHIRYVHPEDYRYAVQLYGSLRPPPDAVSFSELSRQVGRNLSSLDYWVKRNSVPFMTRRRSNSSQLARYLSRDDAERYRQFTRTTQDRLCPMREAA